MNSLLLKNQHKVSWNEYGSTDGFPVFYLHGMPGSRLEATSGDSAAQAFDIRLIAVDRPGYGDSEPANITLREFADAIGQLANHLNFSKFSVLGYSAGGPYALACSHELSDRVKRCAVVSTLAPFDTDVVQTHINQGFKPLYELAAVDREAATQQVSHIASSPEALLDTMQAQLPPCDQELFQTAFRRQYQDSLVLAVKNGANGLVNDLHNLATPWQFELENIHTEVDIWHAKEDTIVGFPISEYLTDTLKNSFVHFLENKGHYFLFEKWNEILATLK